MARVARKWGGARTLAVSRYLPIMVVEVRMWHYMYHGCNGSLGAPCIGMLQSVVARMIKCECAMWQGSRLCSCLLLACNVPLQTVARVVWRKELAGAVLERHARHPAMLRCIASLASPACMRVRVRLQRHTTSKEQATAQATALPRCTLALDHAGHHTLQDADAWRSKTAIASVVHAMPHTHFYNHDGEVSRHGKCARSAPLPSDSRQCRTQSPEPMPRISR